MAIIFADIFPEINKVYEYMQKLNRTEITFGRTTYTFSAVSDTRPKLRVCAVKDKYRSYGSTESTSELMNEYTVICVNFDESSQLSRHNRSVVKSIYKTIFSKFKNIIATIEENTEPLTKLESDLTKLKTQLEMLRGIRNLEKTCPRYIKICGVVIPLAVPPINLFDDWLHELDKAFYRLQESRFDFVRAHNTRTSIRAKSDISDSIVVINNIIESVKNQIDPFIRGKQFSWIISPVNAKTFSVNLNLGAMNPLDSSGQKYIFDPDKILGTGDTFHKILATSKPRISVLYDGKIADWTNSFLVEDLNAVLAMNGINTSSLAPMLSKVALEKVGKIGRIFSTVKVIEQKIAAEMVSESFVTKTTKYTKPTYQLTEWLEKIKTKLKEIGVDPDVSVL